MVCAGIAVIGCLGAMARPGAAQNGSTATPADTLRGATATAIEVMTTNDLQHMRSALEEDIQVRLRAHGIQILPKGSYPKLAFRLSAIDASVSSPRTIASNHYKIVTFRLEFRQLLPLPKAMDRVADATTWETGSYGFLELQEVAERIRGKLGAMIGEFEADHRSVNPPSTGPTVAGNTYIYANVAEDFVPPIPPGSRVVIQMPQKIKIGALIRVKTGPLDTAVVNEAWGDSPFTRYQGKAEMAVFQEDFKASAAGNVLSCVYRTEPPKASGLGAVKAYWFWYRTRPASSAAERLEQRISGHPLLAFKNPVEACPATLDLVR